MACQPLKKMFFHWKHLEFPTGFFISAGDLLGASPEALARGQIWRLITPVMFGYPEDPSMKPWETWDHPNGMGDLSWNPKKDAWKACFCGEVCSWGCRKFGKRHLFVRHDESVHVFFGNTGIYQPVAKQIFVAPLLTFSPGCMRIWPIFSLMSCNPATKNYSNRGGECHVGVIEWSFKSDMVIHVVGRLMILDFYFPKSI